MSTRQHDAGGIRDLRRSAAPRAPRRSPRRTGAGCRVTRAWARSAIAWLRGTGDGARSRPTRSDQRDACYFGVPPQHVAMVARSTMAAGCLSRSSSREPTPYFTPRHRPRCVESSLPAAAIQLHRLSRRRQRSRPAASPRGPRTSTSAPTPTRTRSRSCSEIAGSSAAAFASPTCASAPRRSRWPRSVATCCPEPRTSRRPPTQPPTRRRPICRFRHDNTFGTPEEDAFRRDFTINALFYDIATFSIIDYVGGLQDLRDGVIRSIGEPSQRFQEDPVRMFRAVAFAARLGFALDPPVVEGIRAERALDRQRFAGPPDRGILQSAAIGRGRADVPPAGPPRPARNHHAGAAPRRVRRGALAGARRVGSLSPAIRVAAGRTHQLGAARDTAGAARTDASS